MATLGAGTGVAGAGVTTLGFNSGAAGSGDAAGRSRAIGGSTGFEGAPAGGSVFFFTFAVSFT
jgi:hypothetical protein